MDKAIFLQYAMPTVIPSLQTNFLLISTCLLHLHVHYSSKKRFLKEKKHLIYLN